MAPLTRSLVAFAHVADVERSIRFYADLGFKVTNSLAHEDGGARVWAWLESDRASLMVGTASEPVDASRQGVLFYLYCDDVQQAHDALTERGRAPGEVRRPFYMPAGEFRLEDPDGYVLMVAQV